MHTRKRALLEGASGVFERGGKKAPEIDVEQAKIGEQAIANDFFVQNA